ncbi:MAG: hypothetical protein H0X29_03925 [Parachlamydiaceae bacterium]|nr:hypothetical protein [Parachlamydiaceae bacterium]
MYTYLKKPMPCEPVFKQSDYFLVILTDARHLDYTSNLSFFKTVAKHPDDACKHGDVGHTWIYLQGIKNNERIYLEGGYSGESGRLQARYFDGIMNYIDFGYANPTSEELESPRYEDNPAKYLWETQYDGFFQWGPGFHRPTYAAKVDISAEQFGRIWTFINNFYYREYSIINSQCSSFAAQVASIAGLKLNCEVHIPIDAEMKIGGQNLHFWTDPTYALLTVSSPDMIERSLMEAVREGRAEYALEWYQKAYPEAWKTRSKRWRKNITRFPARLARYLLIIS